MARRTEQIDGRGYFDLRGFLIRGGRGIAVENDFAAGSGPARQARARLHAVVDPEPDRRIALVWAARNEGGLSSWAEPEPASKGGTRLYTRDDALSCDADRAACRSRRHFQGEVADGSENLSRECDARSRLPREQGSQNIGQRTVSMTRPSTARRCGQAKNSEGKAEHVLSAFCSSLQTVLGHEASRSKGLGNSRCAEAPGAGST